MYKNFFIILIFLLVPFFNCSAETFFRDLQIGDRGDDVLELQKLLNKDLDIKIAQSGPGSLGNETDFFGNLTRNALIRFQEKYNIEILTPNNLQYGTGYFGKTTRQKANQLFDFYKNLSTPSQNNQTIETVSTKEVFQDNQETEEITYSDLFGVPRQSEIDNMNYISNNDSGIYYVNTNPVYPNQRISIIAHGLTNSSKIYFVGYGLKESVENLEIVNDGNANFNVPDIRGGKFEVVIDNNGLISSPFIMHIYQKYISFNGKTYWSLVDYNPPSIKSISGQPIKYGDTIIIKGSNFTLKDNLIYTPIGNYLVDAKDSSTIELKFNRPDFLIEQTVHESYFESFIYISNKNGVSNQIKTSFGSEEYITPVTDKNSKSSGGSNSSLPTAILGVAGGLAVGAVVSDLVDNAGQKATSEIVDNVAGGLGIEYFQDDFSLFPTYGGRLMSVMPCPCSFNLMMYIFDYKTNSLKKLIYQPGVSKLLAGTPTGFYQLGSYNPVGACLFFEEDGCFPIPSDGTAGAGSPGYGTSN